MEKSWIKVDFFLKCTFLLFSYQFSYAWRYIDVWRHQNLHLLFRGEGREKRAYELSYDLVAIWPEKYTMCNFYSQFLTKTDWGEVRIWNFTPKCRNFELDRLKGGFQMKIETNISLLRGHAQTTWKNEGGGGLLRWPQHLITAI